MQIAKARLLVINKIEAYLSYSIVQHPTKPESNANQRNAKQMSWNALPIELKNKILEKRNEMYYKSVNIIKKAWLISRNKYLAAKKIIIDYQIEDIESWYETDFTSGLATPTRTINLLKFTSKIILKKNSFSKEDIDFWQDKLDYFDQTLSGQESMGEVTAIEQHLCLIANKLNIKFINLLRPRRVGLDGLSQYFPDA